MCGPRPRVLPKEDSPQFDSGMTVSEEWACGPLPARELPNALSRLDPGMVAKEVRQRSCLLEAFDV